MYEENSQMERARQGKRKDGEKKEGWEMCVLMHVSKCVCMSVCAPGCSMHVPHVCFC